MHEVVLQLTDEQVRNLKTLAPEEIDSAGVAGGVRTAVTFFLQYGGGKMLDSIGNANPDISGRQVSEIVAA